MSLKEIFYKKDILLLDRLEHLMPKLMLETDVQMYIVVGDEYNEGPMVRSLLPSSFFHARRKSIFIFSLIDGNYKKMIVSKPDFTISNFYEPVLLKPPNFDFEMFYTTFSDDYDIELIRTMAVESESDCIRRIISQVDPKNIALDYSSLTPFSDGISKTNYDYIVASMESDYQSRIISGEELGLRWLETRTEKELIVYEQIVKNTRDIVKKLYSREVITPNLTTIGDARFFLMEEAMRNYGSPWFDATVWIRRKDQAHIENDDEVIREGDLLHCDFGYEQYGLCSDIQEMAYVKGVNDEELVEELRVIHKKAMCVQDCLADSFILGSTGNEILKNALKASKEQGIDRPMIYTHPIGHYGHGPGPTIGSFSNQTFVEGMGEYQLNEHTLYAMELNIREEVRAFNHLSIMYGQEIDVAFIHGKIEFIGGRQKDLHII